MLFMDGGSALPRKIINRIQNKEEPKVTSELFIDVQPKEIHIALTEDKELVEYQREGREASYAVGNMYWGRVKKIMPALNACFVDVGSGKEAFLHYQDLALDSTRTRSTSNR